MAAVEDGQKSSAMEIDVWPKSLLLNAAFAEALSCVRCQDIPRPCYNDEEGLLLCSRCITDDDNVSPVKAVQLMINNLRTHCLTTNGHRNVGSGDGVEGNVEDTSHKNEERMDCCEWIGTINAWTVHSKTCDFVTVDCAECKSFSGQRRKMADHNEECPEVRIDCPSSCGSAIYRKHKTAHLRYECAESLRAQLDAMRRKHKEDIVELNAKSERAVRAEKAKFQAAMSLIRPLLDDIKSQREETLPTERTEPSPSQKHSSGPPPPPTDAVEPSLRPPPPPHSAGPPPPPPDSMVPLLPPPPPPPAEWVVPPPAPKDAVAAANRNNDDAATTPPKVTLLKQIKGFSKEDGLTKNKERTLSVAQQIIQQLNGRRMFIADDTDGDSEEEWEDTEWIE